MFRLDFVLIPHLVTLAYIGSVAGLVGGATHLLFRVWPDSLCPGWIRRRTAHIVSAAYLLSAAYAFAVLAYAGVIPGEPNAKWLEVPADVFGFLGMSVAYGAVTGAFVTYRYGIKRQLLDPPDKYQDWGLVVGLLGGIAVYIFVPGLG